MITVTPSDKETSPMKKLIRPLLFLLFAVYVGTVLILTVFRPGFMAKPFFHGTISYIPTSQYAGMLANNNVYGFIINFFGNIGWFFPLGVFLILLFDSNAQDTKPFFRSHRFYFILTGFCLSFIIEICQHIFSVGTCEIDDLILNTLGTWLGVIATIKIKYLPFAT